MKRNSLLLIFLLVLLTCCKSEDAPINAIKPNEPGSINEEYMSRAETTFANIFKYYWSERVGLMFGTYPNTLGTHDEPNSPDYNSHAYLWGLGGVLSGFNAIVQNTDNVDFRTTYESQLKRTLLEYYNTTKEPMCFGCFVNDHDERLYDDAIWVGIDLTDLYSKTKDNWYLNYAKSVWNFVLTGKDDALGGGIYWKESPRDSKNTCSNAPAVVLALKLYQVTNDPSYLETGKEVYKWVKSKLQDPADYLYWDCIKIDGTVETSKFSYNSGQMLQAAVLLYNATGDAQYLTDAKLLAEACYNYFFENFVSNYSGEQFRILKDGKRWFNAIMVRGFLELNKVESNGTYMLAIRKSLDHAWKYTRDAETGLFFKQFSGNEITDNPGDILDQGAIVELYAKLAVN